MYAVEQLATRRPTMKQRPAAVLSLLAFASIAGADVLYRTVALTGTGAPGVPGVTYKFLTDARINSSGKVVFWAELQGPGVTADNDGSLWLNQASGTTLVMREGNVVPGVPDSVFAS